MNKTNRNFSIDIDLSERLDKSINILKELRSMELPFDNVSQLVNSIIAETLPQIEQKIEEIKGKKGKNLRM